MQLRCDLAVLRKWTGHRLCNASHWWILCSAINYLKRVASNEVLLVLTRNRIKHPRSRLRNSLSNVRVATQKCMPLAASETLNSIKRRGFRTHPASESRALLDNLIVFHPRNAAHHQVRYARLSLRCGSRSAYYVHRGCGQRSPQYKQPAHQVHHRYEQLQWWYHSRPCRFPSVIIRELDLFAITITRPSTTMQPLSQNSSKMPTQMSS